MSKTPFPDDVTFTEDFRRLLEAWEAFEREVDRLFPGATPERKYELVSAAMNRALGFAAPITKKPNDKEGT